MGPNANDNQTREASEGGRAAPVCGERLAATRRERGVSVREIAKELHLDEPKVRALEENRFEELGAPVFAKGHMRKYAQLVGVPIDDLLADYYQLNRSAGAPPVVGPSRKASREMPIGPWVAGIIAIVVIASALLWWLNREPAVDAVSVEPETQAPVESGLQDDSIPAPDDGTSADDETVTDESSEDAEISPAVEEPQVTVIETTAESEPVVQETQASLEVENVPVGDTVELILSFSGDCWTEITDATGRRLFFALGTNGRSVTLNGVEPIGVLLGSSSNVSIQVNGLDYDIPAANRRGNTARLTIYGQ
jgi:cytoskeleton protein RodZ